MRIVHWALIAGAASWFIAGAWWIGRRSGCDCGFAHSRTEASTPSAVTQLGPPSSAIASAAIGAPVASPDPILADPLVIRFNKNAGGPAMPSEAQAWLAAAAMWLSTNGTASLNITGYTDADGDPAINQRLSRVRAEQVQAMLVDAGLPADRLRAEGAGASNPIADNLTSKGKALNRRVEVALITVSESIAAP